jgi:hypothetical protein
MNIDDDEMKEAAAAILQIFTVLDMFGFNAGDDLRLGSFMHLFEEDGASREQVDQALNLLMRRQILVRNLSPDVRPGGHVLTEEGAALMTKTLGTSPG